MTKKHFAIKTDSGAREYVYQQIDEFDKNHRDEATPDDTVGEARMYARVIDPLRPVFLFKLYLEKLHPAPDELCDKNDHELQPQGDHNKTETRSEAQPLFGLSSAEIEALFSFICISDNVDKENATLPAVSSNFQLSMKNVQPCWNTHTMNLFPNFTNIVVNLNIHK
ncbi:unnamed protein product [Mytilus coruscus]|uniref:Uncharacterized protein n=1 Tax=Mytilus coruscus TaxID=42192 RepID=A0A6J8DXX6_MYTCO|nr:unnamed protein product [Mytilus coruscus]